MMRKICHGFMIAALMMSMTGSIAAAEVSPDAEYYYQLIDNSFGSQPGYANMNAEITFADPVWNDQCAEVTGLVSAMVRDFDGDGVLELLTVTQTALPYSESVVGNLMGASHDTSLALRLDLYRQVSDSSYQHIAEVNAISVMEGNSWGSMGVGVYEKDGQYYFYGESEMIDRQTYGPSPELLYTLEDEGFVLLDVGGFIGWGQSSYSGDINADAHAAGNPLGTSEMDGIRRSMDSARQGENIHAIPGFTALCTIDMPVNETNTISYTAVDHTRVRDIVSGDVNDILAQMTPAPDFSEADTSAADDFNSSLISALEQNAGLIYTLTGEKTSENGYSATYSGSGGCSLTIFFSTEGMLKSIGLYTPGESLTQEWIDTKDTILNMEAFGFDEEVIAPLLGDCGFQIFNYYVADNITVNTNRINSCIFMLQRSA